MTPERLEALRIRGAHPAFAGADRVELVAEVTRLRKELAAALLERDEAWEAHDEKEDVRWPALASVRRRG